MPHAFSKRAFDLLLWTICAVLFAVPMLLIAALVKVTSRGPVFFRQTRLGLHGRPFLLYKFRTMVPNAEKMIGGIFTMKDDPRITPIGLFLRNTSLDELPQLINVIRGEISFVGPRPPVSYELGDWETMEPRFKKRFEVKPGVTGLAQISGRNELSWDEKIVYDLRYIEAFKKHGIWEDFKILLSTPAKVLRMEGSYEVEANVKKDRARLKKQPTS